MTMPRPYALLAEITYRCPLHCPYCSNPVTVESAVPSGEQALRTSHSTANNGELTTDEWKRIICEAAALGILQIGFSGGEPLARRDRCLLTRGRNAAPRPRAERGRGVPAERLDLTATVSAES